MFDTPHPEDVRRTWDLLIVPDAVVEVRMLRRDRPPLIGRFTLSDAFVSAVRQADHRPEISGIYATLNPVRADAPWSGPLNRMRQGGQAARDADVVCRRWLLIDCDPQRPAKSNATVTERETAFAKAGEIGSTLRQLGWPDPVQAASGNGSHLLYRIPEWPNTPHVTEYMQRILKTLAARFSDAQVDVDISVFNASRISKIYGTMPKKGQPLPDRPWWPAVLVAVPEPLTPSTAELVRRIAPWDPDSPFISHPQSHRPIVSPDPSRRSSGWTRDLGSVLNRLASWGVDIVADPIPLADGRTKILIVCPWAGEHTTDHTLNESAVLWSPSGALGFHCFHRHCADKTWRDFKLAVMVWKNLQGNP